MKTLLDYYNEELSEKKTGSAKKGYLTKQEKLLKEHLKDLLEYKKGGWLHGERITPIRIVKVKTELKIIENLRSQIEKGLKAPAKGLDDFKKLSTDVLQQWMKNNNYMLSGNVKEQQLYNKATKEFRSRFKKTKKSVSKISSKKIIKKSKAASFVLQLMDQDYSYQKALKEVLQNDKRLNKKKLETELDKYI